MGQEARLCFGGPILMGSRHGLCAHFTIPVPIAESEPVLALRQTQAHQKLHAGVRVKKVGADQVYLGNDFMAACREQTIAPQVACKYGGSDAGPDGRTTTEASYRISQKIRKLVEEISGWIKTGGGLRR